MTEARVTLAHHWTEHECTVVIVECSGFPDCADQARAVAVRALADALGVVTSETLADGDAD